MILDITKFKVICQICGKTGEVDLTKYIQGFFIRKTSMGEYRDKGEIKSKPNYYLCRECSGIWG